MRLRGGLFFLGFFLVFSLACDKSRFERLKQHVNTALALMPAAQAVVDELHADGTLDNTNHDAITNEIGNITRGLTEFQAVAKTQPGFTDESKAYFLKLAATIAESARRLNDSGALHIKNPKKKEQFSRVCRAISVSAGIVHAIVSESDAEPEPGTQPEDQTPPGSEIKPQPEIEPG